MGCAVNGPGEARAADIGIAGGDGQGMLIKKGEIVSRFDEAELEERLLSEIEEMTGEKIER
jgi:(E)-4-hydroxy-3-methylbut-2-enyl-diphosphate synthase